MQQAAGISVVMPAFGAAETIVGAVASLRAQTRPDWRLIVIADDGADYEAILARAGIADSRLRFLSSPGIRTGASGTRNVGLDAVTTRYAALLDADDRLHPEKLARLLAALADWPIVSTALAVVDAQLQPLRQVAAGPDQPLGLARHKWVNFSMDAMIGWDRTRTDARFDPGLPNMNDLDFLLRLFERTASSFHLGLPLHLYVKQPQSLSNGDGVTERMLAAKTAIRQRLRNGGYRLADPAAAAEVDAFLDISMAAERLYPAARAARPDLLFEDHIEPLLRAARPDAAAG